MKISRKMCYLIAIAACICSVQSSMAAEGGGSHYLQGTYGDFGMALSTPPGFYLVDSVIYMGGDVGPVSRGNYILDEYKQDTWVNTLKLIYVHDKKVLGGNLGLVVGLPYVLNVAVKGNIISPFPVAFDGSSHGLSDPYVHSFLNWKLGEFSYLTAGITLFSDFGSYDANKVINLGRNYLSVDPVVSYTYLNTENGREFSVVGGIMFNEENDATSYKTGDELHIDFMIAQHFPNNMAVGLTGYYYDQISDDVGDVIADIPLATKGFRSSGYGIGPALLWTLKRQEANPITFIAKWIHDLDATNRLDADVVVVTAVFKF